MKKISLAFAALAVVTLFASCTWGKQVDWSGIDYTNYVDYSIKVRNESSKNVVCFKGSPSAATLISGATAGGITGLKNIFGSQSQDFVLFCVTAEDFIKYPDYKELENHPLCRIYAYYNAEAENRANNIYTISNKLGGDSYFELQNSTQYNCELRRDGLYGEPFMFAGAYTNNTKVYAEPGKYTFYPVFRKFDKTAGTILTSYPKDSNQKPAFEQIFLQTGDENARLNVSKYLNGAEIKISASAAYISIHNGNDVAIQLFKGASATATPTDLDALGINSGKDGTYTVKMDSLGDGQYQTQKSISGWKVGNDNYDTPIEDIVLEAGYRYQLNVTGAASSPTCKWEIAQKDHPKGWYNAGDIVRYLVDIDSEN